MNHLHDLQKLLSVIMVRTRTQQVWLRLFLFGVLSLKHREKKKANAVRAFFSFSPLICDLTLCQYSDAV